MTHTINYNPETRIIEIKVQGDFSLKEVREIISESMRVAKEQNCFLILNDLREAKLKISIVEVYEIPNIISGLLAPSGHHAHEFKRAFVAPTGLTDYRFFETVSTNRGQTAKLFYNIDKARKWLIEE